ncbi:MAG: hypothetical protein R3252_07605, partial [Robiginitalea sp.]|nr:hypothetical protein [Robiginitalea sp.]
MKKTALFSIALTILLGAGCKGEKKETEATEITAEPETPAVVAQTSESSHTGTYADESYAKRSEGYDWVGVRVTEAGDGRLWISVRSRADKKKPTCTFDGNVYKVSENTYETVLEGKTAVFEFTGDALTIRPKTEADAQALYFRCSGGATMAGTYSRIEGDLDPEQVDPTTFMKYLTLQDVSFNLSAVEKEGKQELTIRSIGLEHSDDDPIILSISGNILDADIEDLNSDGSPEVVVFSRDGNRGNVQGVSVNSKQSMSMFYFPPMEN